MLFPFKNFFRSSIRQFPHRLLEIMLIVSLSFQLCLSQLFSLEDRFWQKCLFFPVSFFFYKTSFFYTYISYDVLRTNYFRNGMIILSFHIFWKVFPIQCFVLSKFSSGKLYFGFHLAFNLCLHFLFLIFFSVSNYTSLFFRFLFSPFIKNVSP